MGGSRENSTRRIEEIESDILERMEATKITIGDVVERFNIEMREYRAEVGEEYFWKAAENVMKKNEKTAIVIYFNLPNSPQLH